MKINKKNPNKLKITLIVTAAVLVLIGVGIGGAYLLNNARQSVVSNDTSQEPSGNNNDINFNPPSQDDIDQANQHKDNIPDSQPPGQNAPDSSLDVTITRADQASAGQPLNIRTVITGTSSGSCYITLKKDGHPPVERTFGVVFQATYATCDQADIAMSQFATGGEWNLTVIVRDGERHSAATTQTININK